MCTQYSLLQCIIWVHAYAIYIAIITLATHAGADAAGMVGDNVDDDAVRVVAKVAQEQFEADDDTTVEQRLLLAGGTAMQESSELVDDQIGSGMSGPRSLYVVS